MKRLILRISALVAVVTLGLIAIAQAQRGAEPSVEPVAADTVAAPREEGEPLPIDAAANARFMPAPPRNTDSDNPLRATVTNVSTGTPATVADDTTRPAVRTLPAPRRAADPFAGRVRGIASQGGSGTDSARVEVASPRPGTSSYPQLVGPATPTAAETAANPPAEVPVPSSPSRFAMGGPAAITPPAEPPLAAAGEPAPLRLDPQNTASSIPDARQAPPVSSYRPGSITAPRSLTPPSALGGAALADPRSPTATAQQNDAVDGTGRPGSKLQEGPQSPQLTIHKTAPPEIQVGKAAKFQVRVINTGQVAATGVEIRDLVPQGTQLIGTTPRAQRGVRGELVWEMGTMQPGQEETVEIELMPTAEGEIGSVATVRFNAVASARSVATKPELEVQVSCPNRVVIGEDVKVTITVTNPGSGVASGVVLEEHVPAGLQHPAGTELEYEVGTLKPNESRKLELTLTAARPGPFTNLLVARGDASLRTESRQDLTIVAPQLNVALDGPSRRYLERKATYTVSISNPGTAPARDVELIAELPVGLQFVSADNQGHYDEASRTVLWRLAELPVNTTGSVNLTTMPVEAGQKTLRIAGSAERVDPVQHTQPIQIEGIAAILFQVVDVDDPIEKGGETAYEIRVLNQGSKASTNVQIEATVPPEMKVVAAEGPARHLIEGNRVRFEGLARLAPKADTTYRIRVQGLQPGDLRVRVQLMTDEMDRPVVKEESTRVYADE